MARPQQRANELTPHYIIQVRPQARLIEIGWARAKEKPALNSETTKQRIEMALQRL
ncbi:hypothetical protein M1M94_02025 [Thermodesulfovibrionales bacterium]|nr:hypothetical protein [Thermodesulfovibrionales bacterium]